MIVNVTSKFSLNFIVNTKIIVNKKLKLRR